MDKNIDHLIARIRKDDTLLREYFSKIKQSDRPYEIRRLLEKAIRMEQKEKEMIQKMQEISHLDE